MGQLVPLCRGCERPPLLPFSRLSETPEPPQAFRRQVAATVRTGILWTLCYQVPCGVSASAGEVVPAERAHTEAAGHLTSRGLLVPGRCRTALTAGQSCGTLLLSPRLICWRPPEKTAVAVFRAQCGTLRPCVTTSHNICGGEHPPYFAVWEGLNVHPPAKATPCSLRQEAAFRWTLACRTRTACLVTDAFLSFDLTEAD